MAVCHDDINAHWFFWIVYCGALFMCGYVARVSTDSTLDSYKFTSPVFTTVKPFVILDFVKGREAPCFTHGAGGEAVTLYGAPWTSQVT